MSKDFDRTKFKGSSIASLKNTRKDAEKKSNVFGGGYTGFHKTEEGINVFRIAPPHSPTDPSYRPIRTTWLTCDVPVLDDDGKETGKTEEKKRRIFIATQHGDGLKEDPVELYIKYANAVAKEEIDNEENRKKFLAPITGWKDKAQKWHPGIRPSTNYVFYAWKDGELGRIEFYSQITKKMEELNIDEDADEMIEVDCFSDPDNGVHLIIEYDKSGKSGEKYKVKKREFHPRKYKDWDEFMENERVTDEQLQELSKQKSLTELYVNTYSLKDFDLALNGLSLFDETNEMGIFDNEEFLADLDVLRQLVPEKTEIQTIKDGDDIEKNFEAGAKKRFEAKEEESDTSKWGKIKCKKLLDAYILDNYGNDQILPELSVKDIRVWAGLALAGEELPFPTDEEPQEPDTEASDIEADTTVKNQSTADRIAAMRKKAGK